MYKLENHMNYIELRPLSFYKWKRVSITTILTDYIPDRSMIYMLT